jgi:hypothetical protein
MHSDHSGRRPRKASRFRILAAVVVVTLLHTMKRAMNRAESADYSMARPRRFHS